MDCNKLTIFFVHGTGVRGAPGHEVLIRKHLVDKRNLPLHVEPSHWGDQAGVQIDDIKKIFPPKRKQVSPSRTDEEISRDYLWRLVLRDPLFELKMFMAIEEEKEENDTTSYYERQVQDTKKKAFTTHVSKDELNDELWLQLEQAGIDRKTFNEAREDIVNSDEYQDFVAALPTTGSSGSYLKAIARAVVARTVVILEAPHDLPILYYREQRDRVIDEFCGWLGPRELGVADLLPPLVINAFKNLLVDTPSPFSHHSFNGAHYKLGDTLHYLARGQDIRAFIYSEVQALPGPVVLLTHSLGGTIAVDLLAEDILHNEGELLKKVKLLITVGSQVPYLYAFNALCSLSRDPRFPATRFPRWINLRDPQDHLSFPGSEIFGEIKVEDKVIESGKLFPRSHSHYWENEKTYKIIVDALKQEHLIDER